MNSARIWFATLLLKKCASRRPPWDASCGRSASPPSGAAAKSRCKPRYGTIATGKSGKWWGNLNQGQVDKSTSRQIPGLEQLKSHRRQSFPILASNLSFLLPSRQQNRVRDISLVHLVDDEATDAILRHILWSQESMMWRCMYNTGIISYLYVITMKNHEHMSRNWGFKKRWKAWF